TIGSVDCLANVTTETLPTSQLVIPTTNAVESESSVIPQTAETAQTAQGEDNEPYAFFSVSAQAVANRLGLTDGLRDFSIENINLLPAALPFKQYQFKSLFTPADFTDGQVRQPEKVILHWQSIDDEEWQPK